MRFKLASTILIITLLLSVACDGNRPDVISFKAVPDCVRQGDTIMLSWEVSGADSVSLDDKLVQGKGSLEIKPEEITAYNLTAKNIYGTIVSSVIINVLPVIRTSSNAEVSQTAAAPDNIELVSEYVYFNNAIMVGADDHFITLRNNKNAHNPSWEELVEFLKADTTDMRLYRNGIFTCGDFAEMLHNNAELKGIRTAIVAVEIITPEGEVIKHSLNAFETTDRGIVFIDSTSSSKGLFSDKIVDVAVNCDYIPCEIYSITGQSKIWSDMGRVTSIDIFQW